MKTFTKLSKKISFGMLLILAISSMTGCKKNEWYDVKSDKQLAVPTTLKDMQALLDNAEVMNAINPAMGEAASDGHYLSDARTATLTGYNRNAYTWSHEQAYTKVPDWIQGSTNGSYKRIYYANLVLDGLYKIPSISSIEKLELDNLKGQALFHRAHAFYELSQLFAPPYELGNSDDKLGIPLRLESDINIPSKRSSLKQTYDQIINDLKLAESLLQINSNYKTRPSKIAVYALLARIYLSMEDYTQANIYSNLCLEHYNTLLNYNTLNSTTTANPIAGYNPEVIFHSTRIGIASVAFSNILIEKTWYDAYNDNDLRKKIFFNRNITTNLVTYKGTYSGVGFASIFSGLATDEIYLIRAECSARNGEILKAMEDINTLRKMRWSGTYTNLSASNSEDALIKVLEERKKELIMRGLRWSDLRRLNRDPRFVVTLTRIVGGKTYSLEPNSYKYTFPIPDDIIEQTGMLQNEGWK